MMLLMAAAGAELPGFAARGLSRLPAGNYPLKSNLTQTTMR